MNKKIILSGFIITLSLMFSFVVYAEDGVKTENENSPIVCTMDAKMCPDGTYVGRTEPNCEFICPGEKDGEIRNRFREIKGDLKENREEAQIKRDSFKEEVKVIKDELKEQREINKNKFDQMVESVKIEREKFRAEIELNKEQAKEKITEMRNTFKENLKKIKDQNKIISAEKIVEIIFGLNTKITASLSDKTDQIENVLVSIESRATKAEDSGLDVATVKIKIEKAKEVIVSTREAITMQSKKVYEIGTISDETTLRDAMKNLRDVFTKDIKSLREVVKGAHIAVRDAATTLAKIPKIEDTEKPQIEDTNEVENNTTNTTN